MSHTATPVAPVAATEAGALAHYASTCTCGLRLASSLSARAAQREVDAHLDWHARTGR